jgi:hypothetical protein
MIDGTVRLVAVSAVWQAVGVVISVGLGVGVYFLLRRLRKTKPVADVIGGLTGLVGASDDDLHEQDQMLYAAQVHVVGAFTTLYTTSDVQDEILKKVDQALKGQEDLEKEVQRVRSEARRNAARSAEELRQIRADYAAAQANAELERAKRDRLDNRRQAVNVIIAIVPAMAGIYVTLFVHPYYN